MMGLGQRRRWAGQLLAAVCVACGVNCLVGGTQGSGAAQRLGPAYEQEPWGKLPAPGKGPALPVTRYTLINANNLVVRCTDYGGIITEIRTPDKEGRFADIVLGFDKLDDYLRGHPYFGANVGRCANRIAKGVFTLEGKQYKLATNNGPHHLHGGNNGFDKKLWRAEPFVHNVGPGIQFSYTSPNGEEGYPGRLSVTIRYTLTDTNELIIDYRATTDAPTLCNLAHHSYFNLAGHDQGTILEHEAHFAAAHYTPADDTLIPTGKIAPVSGTPFDFTRPKPIGKDLAQAGGQPVGYDLNFVLDKGPTERPEFAARIVDPRSGRTLEVYTTEPGLQFYTGNFLDGTLKGKGGAVYQQYAGFCLEPQKYPDSIHQPQWWDKSNPILKPGEIYKQTTIYKFGVRK
ncbi:MAG: aldose epimerase family protein [Thermogemmata sp.]